MPDNGRSEPSLTQFYSDEIESQSPDPGILLIQDLALRDPVDAAQFTDEFDSDDGGTITDDVSKKDVDYIADLALRAVAGVETRHWPAHEARCRILTHRYLDEMATLADAIMDSDDTEVPQDHDGADLGSSATNTQLGAPRARGPPNANAPRKRKRRGSNEQDDSPGRGKVQLDVEGHQGKQKKPDVKLSCPYRARNPIRFNVRDAHSCAMTYFSNFSDLRQVKGQLY
jgi:hypothetical protein